MNVYIYKADLYCEGCGKLIRGRLDAEGLRPADPDDESSYDSDDYPKGPYPDGGEEADTPRHCGMCRLFLRNPLTEDGERYVKDAQTDWTFSSVAITQWREFYSYLFDGNDEEEEEYDYAQDDFNFDAARERESRR